MAGLQRLNCRVPRYISQRVRSEIQIRGPQIQTRTSSWIETDNGGAAEIENRALSDK